jgi:hypothetical protein
MKNLRLATTGPAFAGLLGLFITATTAIGQQDALFVAPSGNVGIGTTSPAVPLHVSRNAGGLANLLRLTNNGGIQFLLERTDGNDWQFSNFGPSVEISIPGSPVAQFSLRSNGDLLIGNNVYANGVLLTSSGRLKRDFATVDGRAVLARLVRLPVSEWSFAFDSEQVRHIGPTAEDFQEAFGLGQTGDGLHLTDVNGVALAALQGLYAELEDRDGQIAALRQGQADLLERLSALERVLAQE